MPFTFNGIGTTYYGQREFRPDTSYVTTEWFVLAYIPLVPLKSARLLALPDASTNLIVYSSQRYLALERPPLNWGQVLATYGFIALMVVWVILLGRVAESVASTVNSVVAIPTFIVLFLLLLLLPWQLRRAAKRRVVFSQEAVMETLERLGLLTSAPPTPPPLPAGASVPPPLPGRGC